MYMKEKDITTRQKVTFQDRSPNRIYNPHLELPQYPPVPKGTLSSSLHIETVAKGSELLNTIEYISLKHILSLFSNDYTESEGEMDFVDPLWKTIVKAYRGNKDNVFKEPILSHSNAETVAGLWLVYSIPTLIQFILRQVALQCISS